MIAPDLVQTFRTQARDIIGKELAESSLTNPTEDEEQRAWALLVKLVESENSERKYKKVPALTEEDCNCVAQILFDELFRLGPLQEYLEDESIEEIIINRFDRGFLVRGDGTKEPFTPTFASDDQVRLLLSRVMARTGRRVDESSPAVDVRLPDGSRLHAILPPLAESPSITIRRHRLKVDSLAELVSLGTLSPEAARFLAAAVEGGLNIIVSGGTGSGKTTTLNALGRAIPTSERVVTIEETAELRLNDFLPDCVPLEQRKANAEGFGEISTRELVRHALRMRPSRIIVGEVRGPEALDMLSAMNTGHEGSMGTIHASDARQALSKLQIYMLMGNEPISPDLASRIIAETVDLVVHLKFSKNGTRSVVQISEVAGLEAGQLLMNDLFRLEDGQLTRTSIRPRAADRLADIFPPADYAAFPVTANGYRSS